MENRNNITQLIIKYHHGETTHDENNLLLKLIQKDPWVKKEFLQYKNVDSDVFLVQNNVKFDAEKAYHKFTQIIQSVPPEGKKRKLVPSIYWIAASVIIFVIGTIAIFKQQAPAIHTLVTTNIENIVLSDGSEVTLNRNSSIVYPDNFSKADKKRVVKFKGEGYFKIKKSPGKPFIINMNKLFIEVKGTAFNVFNDTVSNNIKITVEDGLVEVKTTNTNKSLFVKKGEEATYNNISDELTVASDIDPNFLSWKTGILIFENTPLKKVVEDLEKYYHVHFEIMDQEINSLKLDAKINNYKIEEIIQMLELAFNIKITKTDNAYQLENDAEI